MVEIDNMFINVEANLVLPLCQRRSALTPIHAQPGSCKTEFLARGVRVMRGDPKQAAPIAQVEPSPKKIT